MKINVEMIKDCNPCSDGLNWYITNGNEDLKETLVEVTKFGRFDWARWLMTRLMNVQQRRELAIFCAEQVLPIF